MPETILPESQTTPSSKGLPGRFIGVLTSPRDTFADIVRKPTWLGMFLLVAILIGGLSAWFSGTAVGRAASAEQAIKATQTFIKLPPERVDAIREQIMTASSTRIYLQTAISTTVFIPLVAAICAGILLGVFNGLMGGNASFRQVFAIVIFSQAVGTLKVIFATPVNYFRESLSNPTTFAALAPMLDETSLPAKILGSIDFFTLWWLVTLSIGLSVLYKRPTRGIAMSLIGIYVVLAVTIAVCIALING